MMFCKTFDYKGKKIKIRSVEKNDALEQYPIPILVYKITKATQEQIDKLMILGFIDWDLVENSSIGPDIIWKEAIKNYLVYLAQNDDEIEIFKSILKK